LKAQVKETLIVWKYPLIAKHDSLWKEALDRIFDLS